MKAKGITKEKINIFKKVKNILTERKKCDIIHRHKKLCGKIVRCINRNSKTASCASANHL